MGFLMKYRKPIPCVQVRILFSFEELNALLKHLNETYGLIDDNLSEEEALILKTLAGNFLGIYRELENDPCDFMNIPNFTEPDDLPDTIEIFEPMSYIYDQSETERLVIASADTMSLGVCFGVSAIARLIELRSNLLEGKEPVAEAPVDWAYQLFDDAFYRNHHLRDKKIKILKTIASAIYDHFIDETEDDTNPPPPSGDIIEELRKEFLT
jgi:hypothetical protein